EEKEEKERQEFQKQIVSERPKHDKFVETVGKLYDIGRDDGKAQEITDLYNSLEFEQIDEPEYYFFNTDALYNIKELAAKKKADAKSVKKFVGELLWLRYLEVFQKPKKERYDRLERIEYIFKGFYRGPGKSDSKYTLEYLEDMAKTYGNRFNKLAETIHLLRSQRGILGKTNSLNKMRNVLVTLEKLNETLESLKSDDLLKILAESLQKMQIEPLINEVKQKMEAREKKEKESPKKKFPYTAKPGSELDGASEDGRYVPYISGSTGKEKIAGEGGYGTVGIYWDTQEKCKVAIKTKRDETIFGSKITDLPQIKSPYVAALKDLTTLIIDGQKVPGLVMEYVHGQTCFMDQIYRLSPEKLLETCKQLIDAFEAFAKAGVHQWDLDQHFQNVRIDKNGNIKIIDYDDASTGGGYNRVYATTYVIAALSAYRNGDELREKFLEQFPELDGQVKEDDYTPYMYKVSDNVPTFGELRVALDRLKEQKVFG
ncbi:MAG: hypothetical protein Q4D57_07125, partial [Clostridia bacterium]|nr:hypothetical protein [Clostridia bacterium]